MPLTVRPAFWVALDTITGEIIGAPDAAGHALLSVPADLFFMSGDRDSR